ncbi:MAG: Hint domain-containing protein [Amylibacter sp.]|nr:Hint domain-containing protein [Amylibacter sp.]
MALILDWDNIGSSNGSTTVTNGTDSVNVTISTPGSPFYNAFGGGAIWGSNISTPQTSTLTFDTPVKNVTFEIYDLDANGTAWSDSVTINAIDKDGNPVSISFSDLEAYHIQTGNTVSATGNSGTSIDTSGAPDSITVTIPGPLTQIQVMYDNGPTATSSGAFGWGATTFDVVCFTKDVLITTPSGDRLVQGLAVGDLVLTRDHGLQAIRWIGHKSLTGARLYASPNLRPVTIKKDTYGAGIPAQDLSVSPQHRILIKNSDTVLMFNQSEVLAPAKGLVNDTDIFVNDTVTSVEYYHIMFDHHEVIYSNGMPTESFQPSDRSLLAFDQDIRNELFTLFPELKENAHAANTPARHSLNVQETRLIA